MPDERPANLLDAILNTVKNAFSVLREIVLLAVFMVLIFFPRSLNSRLSQAGLTRIDGGVFTWEQQKEINNSVDQSKAAAQANSAATESLNQAKATISALAGKSTDKEVIAQANAAIFKVDGSLSSLHAADQSLVKSLVTQQGILQSASNGSGGRAGSSADVGASGWVYLGEIDATGKRWMVPPEPKVGANAPTPAAGQTVTLSDDVYLRADKGPGQTFSQAAIVRAVSAGTAVTITDVQPSAALNGGKFIWAKVTVKGS
ncbi:MAG TPA: hypothetical protein VGD59_08025 [Acidisarcina sp.]